MAMDLGFFSSDFVNWYDESSLCLNVSKKEKSINFRNESVQPQPTIVHNEAVAWHLLTLLSIFEW